MRELEYTIYGDSINPAAIQDGGMQGEDNAVNVVFLLDGSFTSGIIETINHSPAGTTAKFRLDVTKGDGSYYSVTSPEGGLKVTYSGTVPVSAEYPLPDAVTLVGGVCVIYLAVEILSPENNAVQIIFSKPAKISFTATSNGSGSQTAYVNSIFGALEQAEQYAGQASAASEEISQKIITSVDSQTTVIGEGDKIRVVGVSNPEGDKTLDYSAIAKVNDMKMFSHEGSVNPDALTELGIHYINGSVTGAPDTSVGVHTLFVYESEVNVEHERPQVLYINNDVYKRTYSAGYPELTTLWEKQDRVNLKQNKTISDTGKHFTDKTVEGALGELGDHFTQQTGKNLYNPSNAVNGVIRNYGSTAFPPNGYTDYPTGGMSGVMAVEAGKTYCLSWLSADVVFSNNQMFCWDKNYNYLGIINKVSNYQQAYGISAVAPTVTSGRKQMVISLTADSQVAYIEGNLFFTAVTHDTAEFDRRRFSVQLEEGTAFTTFEDTRTTPRKLSPAALPNGYSTLPADVSALKTIGTRVTGSTKVIKNGNDLYIRNAWDSANDIVEKVSLLYSSDVGNAPFEFVNIGLIPKASADSSVPATAITQLKECTDDISPISCNGGYIGGNHALYSVYKITKTAHGKTVQDVGSEWVDGASRKFYIMKIIDANTLWVLSENTSTDDVWIFSDITGTTLTHSAGATHTTSIIFTAKSLEQMYPGIKNQTKRLLLDGNYEIFGDGIYLCKYLEVLHSYDISYPPAILDFVKSKVGSSTQPDFTDSSIAVFARISNVYRFYKNTSCTLYHSCKFKKNTALAYLMGTQANVVDIPVGGTLHEYIPGVNSFTIGSNIYNFKAIQPITTLTDLIEITPDRMSDTTNPPSRFVQFAKKSDGSKYNNFGFTLGYCTDIGDCKPSVRKNNINSAFWLNSGTRKQYPKAMTGSSTAIPAGTRVAAGTTVNFVAFRSAVNYANDPDATNISWYYVGNDIYLNLDYHVNIDKTLKLPDEMIGKIITVVEKNSDFTLKSAYVSSDGIDIKVTNDYGSAVLKLSN